MFAYDYPDEKYHQAGVEGHRNLKKPKIDEYVKFYTQQQAMERDEWLKRQADTARFDPTRYIKKGKARGNYYIDVDLLTQDGYGWMVESISYTNGGDAQIKFLSRETAAQNIGRALGLYSRHEITGRDGEPLIKPVAQDDYDAV